ncbi:MAG: hydroxyisourate hydrolase [Bryobacterales bacterium]|nr:hydroxyisourate hydrolase [Bryobacterales bacterium]MBV9401330.1 hydroxyisourate hydrolase [Bryobacterales bacterium]
MARVSTHVLDTARGVPAGGVTVDLHRLEGAGRFHVKRDATNADGRTSQPLLGGDRIQPGVYELTFYAGEYFRRAGISVPNPPFLDEIVIRFGIADSSANYHVPLLVSPYGYSTYRGS